MQKTRGAAQAEKEAEAVISSLSKASESAVATTLAGITDTLKANTPLMYHLHALLQNEEWRGVLEASARGEAIQQSSQKKKKKADKFLRPNVKKFEHLPRHPFPKDRLSVNTE
jgi:hypothetical protein